MKRKWIKYGLIAALALLSTSIFASEEIVKKKVTTSHHKFQVINKLIVVKAVLEGKSGNYIFDTGATGLLLNAVNHLQLDNSTTSEVIGAIDAHNSSFNTEIKTFRFGTVEKSNFIATCLSLAHIEAALNIKIDGLIGLDIVKDAAILIDYEAQLLTLTDPSEDYASADLNLEMNMISGIATIKANLQHQNLTLAIDFGATTTILDKSTVSGIQLPIIEKTDLLTASGTASDLDKVICNNLKIGHSLELDTKAVLSDLSHLRTEGYAIDGIVGLDLFDAGRVVIDVSNKSMFIWTKK